MSNSKTVWSDEDGGDQRKKRTSTQEGAAPVQAQQVVLQIRRLTSGKGRTVIEIKGLPNNSDWCKDLAKRLKKSLGTGGTYKNDYIEIHGEKIESVTDLLDKLDLKWKKTGG